jgi:hypothetical protein
MDVKTGRAFPVSSAPPPRVDIDFVLYSVHWAAPRRVNGAPRGSWTANEGRSNCCCRLNIDSIHNTYNQMTRSALIATVLLPDFHDSICRYRLVFRINQPTNQLTN